jgi:hypothetical protein
MPIVTIMIAAAANVTIQALWRSIHCDFEGVIDAVAVEADASQLIDEARRQNFAGTSLLFHLFRRLPA